MSASTPTVQGGLRSSQLGAMLLAIVLAIVLVAALVALQATALGPAQAAGGAATGAPSRPSTVALRPSAARSSRLRPRSPVTMAGPLTPARSPCRSRYPAFDRGWSSDGGALLTPMFAVPGDHSAATEGGAIAAPAETHGGRGTRLAR